MANKASELVLRETSGPPDEKNIIVLRGRCLPYRPFTLKGTQRGEVSWYPGNPIGSVQILGPTEEPTTINGMWKDWFIKGSSLATLNGQPLSDARAVVVAVDTMRRQGKDLIVTWDEEVRTGYMSSFERSWDRREDVAWSMELTWTSQGETELPPVTAPTVSISDISIQVGGTIDAISAELEQLDFSATSLTLNTVSNNITALRNRQAELLGIVTAAIQNAVGPIDSVRRTAANLTSIATDALAFTQQLEADVLFSLRSLASPALFTVGLALQATAKVRTIIQSLKALRNFSLVQKSLLLVTADGSVIQELIGIDGDDLRRVAQSVYGNSADWRLIALFNNVRTARIAAGQKIFIPRPNNVGG